MWYLFFYPLIFESIHACSYIAAIYEHRPENNKNLPPKQYINSNLLVYDKQIQLAAYMGANIIVFPEYGLTAFHEKPQEMEPYLEKIPNLDNKSFVNPCHDISVYNDSALRSLSCLAKKYKIYVVANLGEKADKEPHALKNFFFIDGICGNLSSSNNVTSLYKQYNTNIAFDSSGNLIAKFRKCHLCGEPNFNYPDTCELVTFKTDFTMEPFGIFTCFDINWKLPAFDLIEKLGVKNIVFPTDWPDVLPFLTANAIQSAYSVMANVNLLAANLHEDGYLGSRGSGIYSGKMGALKTTYKFQNGSGGQLLIAEVPCKPGDNSQIKNKLHSKLLRRFPSNTYNFMDTQHFKDIQHAETFLEDINGPESFETDIILTNKIYMNGNEIIDMLYAETKRIEKNHVLGTNNTTSNSAFKRDFREKLQNIFTSTLINHVPYKIIKKPLPFSHDESYRNENDAFYYRKEPQSTLQLSHTSVCNGTFCCHLSYQFDPISITKDTLSTNGKEMVLAVYNGLQMEYKSWWISICAFAVCNVDLNSGHCVSFDRDTLPYQFSYFNLTAQNMIKKSAKNTHVYPIVLTEGAELPPKAEWWFHENVPSIVAVQGLSKPLLSAALWGRPFDQDP